MEWTIYSFGATKYLESVFNAIAMYSNSGNFDGMFKVALGIGIILITVQCILDGGKTIKFQMPAIAIAIYMAMFSATTRVQLEDTYTGQVAVVDNVPYGVVVIGSIISTAGHSITQGMELAFSTPGMTRYGMIDPLVTIANAKDTFSSPMTLAVMAGGNLNVNIAESIKNYLNDCTMRSVLDGSQTLDKIYSSSSGVEALAVSNAAVYTKIYDGAGTNSTSFNPTRASLLTCDNAWAKIKNLLAANEGRAWNLVACRSPESQSASESAATTCASGGSNAKARVDSAINYLGWLSQSSSTLQQMMILGPFLDRAVVRKENSIFQDASAIQRANALDQQNVALAGKGSAFLTWAQPLMTFIQGMIFGITPFMVFVLGLGLMGLKMLGKYFLVLVWVQLWFPILAIINMYVITRTSESLAVINTQGLTFDTLSEALRTISMDAGLAGNLIAATPALAGFIVWGSSVAFSSMASQMTSSQGVDPKTLAPDLVNPAPVIQQGSAYQSDVASGVRATGTDAATGTLNSSQVLGASVSSSSARARAAQDNLSSEVNSTLQRATQVATSAGMGAEFRQAYNNNLTRAVGGGATSSSGINTGSTTGYSEKSNTSNQQSQTLGGSAQAGLELVGTGVVGKASIDSKNSSGNDTSNDMSAKRDYVTGQGSTEGTTVQNATAEQKAAALLETLNQTRSYTGGASTAEGVKRALTESNTASEEYRVLSQLSQTEGTGHQMPVLQAANIALGLDSNTSPEERNGRMATLQQMLEGKQIGNEHLKEYVGRTAERMMERDPSMDQGTAFGAAAITGLSKAGELGTLLTSSISPLEAGGFNINPNKNEHLTGPSKQSIEQLHNKAENVEAGVRSQIQAGASNVNRSPESLYESGKGRVSEAKHSGEATANDHVNESKAAVEGKYNQMAANRVMDYAAGRNNNDSFSKNQAHVSEMAQQAVARLLSDDGQDPQSKDFLNHYNHAMTFDGISSAQAAVYAASKSNVMETSELGRSIYANAYQDSMKMSGNNDTYARGVVESMRDGVRGTNGIDSDHRLIELSHANKAMKVEGYNKDEFAINPNETINRPSYGNGQQSPNSSFNEDIPWLESNPKR